MAVDILVERRGSALVPHDELAEQDVMNLKSSGPFMVNVRKPRSRSHHRFYFALIRSICESGGFDDGEEALHAVTKMNAGCFRVIGLKGLTVRVPDSVAFEKMDQDKFNAFFGRAVSFWQSEGLYEWIKPDMRAKIEQDQPRAA